MVEREVFPGSLTPHHVNQGRMVEVVLRRPAATVKVGSFHQTCTGKNRWIMGTLLADSVQVRDIEIAGA
jgi:hypothetical protein